MTELKITKSQKTALTRISNRVSKMLDGYDPDFKISDDEEFVFCSNNLLYLKGQAADLAEMKQYLSDPLKEAVKRVSELFKAPEKACAEVEKHLKQKLSEYILARREDSQKALESAITDEGADPAKMQAAMSIAAPDVEGISIRESKRVVIRDESLIPEEYYVIDKKKVEKAAKAGVEIPGVLLVDSVTIAASKKS